jgi:hypothetical protein
VDPRDLGWPDDEAPLELRRTHLSEVWLGRTRVLKTKRAVDVGFVDFTTREARRRACEAEVTLNRRLAPDVYLGLRTLPSGEPAVEMRRLRDEDSLLGRLERRQLDADTLVRVGRRIARFHADAETSPRIAERGGSATFRSNALDNYDATAAAVGALVHPDVHRAARAATERAVDALTSRIDERAAAGRIRDTHGDLRLEHVYLIDGEVVVIDCIEFSDRFRYADTALDVAFLAMDLEVRSRWDLAAALWRGWEEGSGDCGARELVPLYVSYRSVVRAKVAGITVADPSTPPDRLAAHTLRARRHWLLAYARLAEAPPVLIGVGGRPGTGKSTLARAVAARGDWVVIRSDVVRRELVQAERYGDAGKDETYRACFRQAEEALFAGKRVIVDASFTKAGWRRMLAEAAARWAVPARIFRCVADDRVVRERLRARVGDASEADEAVYDRVHWEPDPSDVDLVADVDTTADPAGAVRRVDEILSAPW